MRPRFAPYRVDHRFSVEAFYQQMRAHVSRWALFYVLGVAAATVFQASFTLGINASPSLSHRVYLIHKGSLHARGELVAFRWPGGGPHRAGTTFVKILAGVPGDAVTRIERDFFVNGRAVGSAKRWSRTHLALEPGPTGTLPAAHYYVHASHPDSLDSRYALTGWITQDQIIGRAYALF